MAKVLVVEGTKFFRMVLTQKLALAGFEVIGVGTLAEARAAIERHEHDLFMGIFDLVLPDASETEIIDQALSHKLPIVVYTANFSEDARERILSLKVIDYVVKEDPSSLDYVVNLVGRIWRNRLIKALVVDDSSTSRKYLIELLQSYQFMILEANDGVEALEIIDRENDIRLVVTDYHMPRMDGFQLIKAIRRSHSRDQMAIIGISSAGSSTLSARFIKSGANDFLNKPFLREEFFCRIQMNIDILEQLAELKEAATIDFLTGVRNRRSFYEVAGPLLAAGRRGQARVTVGLMDIDRFKEINDQHGHDVGDVVLAEVAQILSSAVRGTDILARFGGEEFCILALNIGDGEAARVYFERLRQLFEDNPITTPSGNFTITVSIGVCNKIKGTLDEMITVADTLLYAAKRAGRNKVILSDDDKV